MQLDGRAELIAYAEREITWFRQTFPLNRSRWTRCLVVTIAGGVLGSILAAVPGSNPWLRFACAIPSALGTIAAALNSSLNYRGEYVRQAVASEKLSRELLKFKVGAFPYDGDKSEDLFMGNIAEILDQELSSWVEQKNADAVVKAASDR